MSIESKFSHPAGSEIAQFQPKSISCIECKKAFIFPTEEQEFYRSQGFTNTPKRCPHCRLLIRMRREGKSTDTMTELNCVECGKKTTVPFLPRNEKEIYCVSCYKQIQRANHTSLAES